MISIIINEYKYIYIRFNSNLYELYILPYNSLLMMNCLSVL
jgi:hypothetical protein